MYIIVQLEFELTDYDIALQHSNHYAMGNLLNKIKKNTHQKLIIIKNASSKKFQQLDMIISTITTGCKQTISKVGDHSRGWPEGCLFDSLLHQGVGEGATPFPGLLHFTLDPYLIMLSVKQGGIKYRFLSLWYDSTWDWTQVSRAIGEHSNL